MKPTYANLIAAVAAKCGLTKRTTRQVLAALKTEVSGATIAHGRFTLPGFVTFKVLRRRAHELRDPRGPEGTKRLIAAHRVVRAVVAKSWRRLDG